MSKSRRPYKNYTPKKSTSPKRHSPAERVTIRVKQTATQTERHVAQTEHTAVQSKQANFKETISLIISAICVLPIFIDIYNKPSIAFKSICYIFFLISLICSLFIHYRRHKKGTPTKGSKFGVIWGLLFFCGFFSFINFQSQPMEKETIFQDQDIEYTEEQLLAQAELHYNGNHYESLIELYTSESLLDNPIALNNLGYMYSNGVYFSQNFNTAIHYYELASAKGSSDAVHNLIALKLHSCTTFEEVVDVLNAGYQSGDNETFLFLGSILRGKELSNAEITNQIRDNLRKEIEGFFTADAETQAKFLSDSLGPWEHLTKFSDTVLHDFGKIYEKYTPLGTRSVYYDDSLVNMYDYLKSTRTFLYDNFMQERFVSVIDSN